MNDTERVAVATVAAAGAVALWHALSSPPAAATPNQNAPPEGIYVNAVTPGLGSHVSIAVTAQGSDLVRDLNADGWGTEILPVTWLGLITETGGGGMEIAGTVYGWEIVSGSTGGGEPIPRLWIRDLQGQLVAVLVPPGDPLADPSVWDWYG